LFSAGDHAGVHVPAVDASLGGREWDADARPRKRIGNVARARSTDVVPRVFRRVARARRLARDAAGRA
jgi:hypothetical protein